MGSNGGTMKKRVHGYDNADMSKMHLVSSATLGLARDIIIVRAFHGSDPISSVVRVRRFSK